MKIKTEVEKSDIVKLNFRIMCNMTDYAEVSFFLRILSMIEWNYFFLFSSDQNLIKTNKNKKWAARRDTYKKINLSDVSDVGHFAVLLCFR